MFEYSYRSQKALASAHPDLQYLFNKVIKVIDCTIIFGHRTEEEQNEMVRKGYSKLIFPRSKHNKMPSLAVDAVPYYSNHNPHIDWQDTDKFYYFAGVVKGIASQLGVEITWGNDWDNDNDFKDTKWVDMPHYELLK